VAIPTDTDASVDPYIRTRMTKDVQVESLLFWPQEKGIYPGIVLLHEWWGLNSQIKDLGARLACEGYGVIIPNLYGRLGGTVTANADVADALMGKLNDSLILQDINSCCEYLNTREYIKRNIHGVIGFGMGGTFAIRFAGQRKRLRTGISYYGRIPATDSVLKELYCPLLYHRGDKDAWVSQQDVDRLTASAKEFGKRLEVRIYPGAGHAFSNETRPDGYRADATAEAWTTTASFLKTCFQGT